MIYRDFKNLKLSTLGIGGMRLPQKEDDTIDEAKAAEIFDYAISNGVNVFDTAFFYHSGQSERVVGNILSKYPRETWYLSNKMPGNFMEVIDGKLHMELGSMGMADQTFNNPAEVFEYQLKNCNVDYFDFYLLHNVFEGTFDLYTDEKIGMVNYLLEEKKAGRIKHFGFSTHGRPETIEKFLSRYDCFEFALLQLNYLDWTLQEASKKYDILTKHGVPIFVMEPVRGGKLAAPGKEAEAILKEAKPNETPASWAFRFLQSLPNVHVTVSGMSTMEQLKENIEIFSKHDPLSDSDKIILQNIVDGMTSFVPCTACKYCCDICPKKLDIPALIATYNEAANEYGWYVDDFLEALDEGKGPEACIGCGVCSPLCPQNIDIAETIAEFVKLINKSK